MGSYDYRSYFNEISNQLDDVLANQETLLTELRDNHTEDLEREQEFHELLFGRFTILTAVLLIGACITVFFK